MSTIQKISDVIPTCFERLQGETLPTVEEAQNALEFIYTEKGGSFRIRSKVKAQANDLARCTHKILKWHNTGGDLHGLMTARFMFSKEVYEQSETFCEVLRLITAQRSQALGAWKQVLGK